MLVDTMLGGMLADVPGEARRLAGLGFDGAFTFEGPHDVFFPLVQAAGAGTDLDLYTNVAIAFPRSAVHLAHAADDLQRLSGGRFRLGLGPQVRAHIERRYGATWTRPVQRMREVVLATKAIQHAWQHGERLDFRGELLSHTLMTPMFDPGPNPFGPPPTLLGALGPRMTALAGEVADGLLIMPFTTERFVRERTLPALAEGRGRSSGGPFEVVAEVIVAAGRDEEERRIAEAGVRGLLSFYGSTPAYAPVLELEGRRALHEELHGLSRTGDWAAMADRIDDELLGTIAVRGTPQSCADQIVSRFGDVADRVAFYLPYAVDPGCVGEVVRAVKAATGAARTGVGRQ